MATAQSPPDELVVALVTKLRETTGDQIRYIKSTLSSMGNKVFIPLNKQLDPTATVEVEIDTRSSTGPSYVVTAPISPFPGSTKYTMDTRTIRDIKTLKKHIARVQAVAIDEWTYRHYLLKELVSAIKRGGGGHAAARGPALPQEEKTINYIANTPVIENHAAYYIPLCASGTTPYMKVTIVSRDRSHQGSPPNYVVQTSVIDMDVEQESETWGIYSGIKTHTFKTPIPTDDEQGCQELKGYIITAQELFYQRDAFLPLSVLKRVVNLEVVQGVASKVQYHIMRPTGAPYADVTVVTEAQDADNTAKTIIVRISVTSTKVRDKNENEILKNAFPNLDQAVQHTVNVQTYNDTMNLVLNYGACPKDRTEFAHKLRRRIQGVLL